MSQLPESAPAPRSPRRRFLFSALAVTVLGLGGWATQVYVKRGMSGGQLTPAGVDVLTHLSRGVLIGFLPADKTARQQRLVQLGQVLAAGVAKFPPAIQLQLGVVLGSLSSAPSRLALTGHWQDIAELPDETMAEWLAGMKHSRSPLVLITYRSIRDLICLQCFSDPVQGRLMTAYPGPMDI